MLRKVQRLDVVNDVYKEDSLKSHVRGLRGTGGRIHKVDNSTKLPRDWKAFLRNDTNKTLLISYLAQEVTSQMKNEQKTMVFTTGERVLSVPDRDSSTLHPCNQEEADSRIFLHADDAVEAGSSSIIIRTNDTDVVVLAVVYAAKTKVQVYVSMGTSENNRRYIDASEIAEKLGSEKCRALLLFHSYTGCDTTSFFRNFGKKRCWAAWDTYPELTSVLIRLTESSSDPEENDLLVMERFICLVYDKNTELSEVNHLRQHLFASKMRQVGHIPPTKAALKYHLMRCILQARIWFQMNRKNVENLDPASYGWIRNQLNQWKPLWTDLPPIGQSRVFVKCGCKDCSNARCGCRKENLPCYIGCGCGGRCSR